MATQQTIQEVFRDLVAVFGDPGMLEEKVRLYADALEDADDAELRQACRLYIQDGRRFPFPADLFALLCPIESMKDYWEARKRPSALGCDCSGHTVYVPENHPTGEGGRMVYVPKGGQPTQSEPGTITVDNRGPGEMVAVRLEEAGFKVLRVYPRGCSGQEK